MRITFIIPCYNVSKTVRRCLDSVYALGMPEGEFEVIAVNDASTDDTLQMLREYGQMHANLVVLNHLVSRNLGAARNTGLAVAKGDCIAFVDSDDEVRPGIMKALQMMEERNLDMVAMRVEYCSYKGELIKEVSLPIPGGNVFSGVQLQSDYPFWRTSVWGHLYSKELLEKVCYPFVEGAYYEDADYLCSHLLHAERMTYCDDSGYCYYVNPGSISHTFLYRHVFSYALMGTRMLSLFDRLDDKSSPSALSVLEGGSIYIMKTFRLVFRLNSVSDVRAFYNLLDSRVDRQSLKKYRKPAYCWTWRTRFWVKHRYWMTFMAGIGLWCRGVIKPCFKQR